MLGDPLELAEPIRVQHTAASPSPIRTPSGSSTANGDDDADEDDATAGVSLASSPTPSSETPQGSSSGSNKKGEGEDGTKDIQPDKFNYGERLKVSSVSKLLLTGRKTIVC